MSTLSKFEVWALRKIFAKAVVQGLSHKANIRQIFRLVNEAAIDEFTEDNTPTLDSYLREQFEASLERN